LLSLNMQDMLQHGMLEAKKYYWKSRWCVDSKRCYINCRDDEPNIMTLSFLIIGYGTSRTWENVLKKIRRKKKE
jgi:hypothetical protein